MSYDVYIELPKPLRHKRKRGEYPPEALEGLEQILAALRRIDPDIEIEREDALLTGDSPVLGALSADPNRLCLRYAGDRSYEAILLGVQGVLGELEALGFEGQDPQVGGRIRHFPDRADFLRQFRSQFLCPDEEFEQWLAGREPAAWRRWRELKEGPGRRYVPASFPPIADMPDWQVLRDMPPSGLYSLLRRLIALNDQRIEQLGLAEFLEQARLRSALGERRGNGDWLPVTDWFPPGTSLGQEIEIMHRLIAHQWPAVMFEQPQQLSVVVDAQSSADRAACNERASLMRGELAKAASGLPGKTICRGSWCDDVGRIDIECADPDAALALLLPILATYRDLPIRILRRYGWRGSREVESALPD